MAALTFAETFFRKQKLAKAGGRSTLRGTPPRSVSLPPSQEISAVAPLPRNWVVDNFRPHETEVRGYLQARFPSIDTDDVVQESYLKLLRLRAVEKIESARGYFFSVAR